MENYRATEITKHGKTLLLFTANLNSTEVPGYITKVVSEAFEKFAEYMKEKMQVMYIRDIPELCVNGTYPYSYCSAREAFIAVDGWGLGMDMMQFTLVVYKELFTMARLQKVGTEGTFGEAVFSEGAGLYFAELMTALEPKCAKVKITHKMRRAAIRHWDSRFFRYHKWFYDGRFGKWIAPAIGYELAKSLYPKGTNIDLRRAVNAYPKWNKSDLKALAWPRLYDWLS